MGYATFRLMRERDALLARSDLLRGGWSQDQERAIDPADAGDALAPEPATDGQLAGASPAPAPSAGRRRRPNPATLPDLPPQ